MSNMTLKPCKNGNGRPLVVRTWLIHFASAVHVTWGICLLFSPDPMRVAPISEVAEWLNFNHVQTGALYLGCAALAWWGAKRHNSDVWSLALGIPQLVLLFMGLTACVDILVDGVHPDGTAASSWFFFSQLANSIWLPFLYMWALYGPYWKALWKEVRRK